MSKDHPHPSLTVDVVLLRWRGRLELLLIERRHDPFGGRFALPGGFVEKDEPPARAAARELLEETGVALPEPPRWLVGVFGEAGRDPRGWTVSTAFLVLADAEVRVQAGDDAAAARWFPLAELPPLAFDHDRIIEAARARLREMAQFDPAPLGLLGDRFRTAQARRLYAEIHGTPVPPTRFKAWLRRRQAVERIGPSRFRPAGQLAPDWLR